MALRYRVPNGVGDVRPKQSLTVSPYLRQPARVEFRRGADMKKVAEEIKQSVSVIVDAAVGAGKSTILPSELAKVYRVLVFHVVPNEIQAMDLHQYVAKQADRLGTGPPLELYMTHGQDLPAMGLVFISSAQLVALMVKEGGLRKYPNCVVFLDEAHESDAYTHVVRNLSLVLGAGVLVQASATFSAGNFRKRESAGVVEELVYEAEDVPETWNPTDMKKPWGFGQLKNNILVYTDSRSQFVCLRDKYEAAGFKVHRLFAGMSREAYAQAMSDLKDVRGPLVMLVADYAFRSCFTYDVGTIIDTGRVAYMDPTPGKLMKKTRQAFAFEMEQAAGRGGRIAGLKTKYYRPNMDVLEVMCELEGVEMEAAAYLYRILGFKPARELASAVMAGYDLPTSVTLEAALNGSYPLSYYVINGEGRPRSSAIAVQVGDEVLSDDDVPALDESRASTPESEDTEFVQDQSRQQPSGFDLGNQWSDLVESLGYKGQIMPIVGKVCSVPTLDPSARNGSMAFPRGYESVMSLFSSKEKYYLVEGLNIYDRQVALRLIVDRYNLCVVEVMAGTKAMAKVVNKLRNPYLSATTREYFTHVIERIYECAIEQDTLYRVMKLLAGNKWHVEILNGVDDVVNRRTEKFLSAFGSVLHEARSTVELHDLSSNVDGLGFIQGRAACEPGKPYKQLNTSNTGWRQLPAVEGVGVGTHPDYTAGGDQGRYGGDTQGLYNQWVTNRGGGISGVSSRRSSSSGSYRGSSLHRRIHDALTACGMTPGWAD